MEAVASRDEVVFTADAAVDGNNAIAQDSSCMIAYSQGTFFRVVAFRNNTTAPAVGLSRVRQKSTKTTLRIIWYNILRSTCFLLHEPEKTKLSDNVAMLRLERTKPAVALPHCSEST